MAAAYELVLRGEIGDHFAVLFEGMRLTRTAGTTIVTGPVRDQAHLHGLIERISELGLELVSVNPIAPTREERMSAPDTIVLVHGFWVTPRSWEHWKAHYEARGFTVIVPAYPGFEVEVEALNADPTPIEQVKFPDIIDPLRGGHRRARAAPDHHRALRRRRDHAGPAGPRPGRRGRRSELRADRGRAGHAALADPLDVRGAEEPRQPPQGRRVHARAVALRVHERLRRGGVAPALRALPHPRVGRHPLGQRPGEHPARPPGHVGRLPQRRPRPAAVRLRQRGPHHAAVRAAVEPQALQVRHDDGDHRVRGPASHDRGRGLGEDRRHRAGLGARAREGAPPRRDGRPHHPHRRADRAHRGGWLAAADRPDVRSPRPQLPLRLGDRVGEARGPGDRGAGHRPDRRGAADPRAPRRQPRPRGARAAAGRRHDRDDRCRGRRGWTATRAASGSGRAPGWRRPGGPRSR